MKKTRRNAKIILFIYSILVFVVIILKFNGNITQLWQGIESRIEYKQMWGEAPHNYIPFRTIGLYAREFPSYTAVRNFLGNTIPFIPFGPLLPFSISKLNNTKYFILVCAISILVCELLQSFTFTGSFDIDDWILNMCGCILGFVIYKNYKGRLKSNVQR